MNDAAFSSRGQQHRRDDVADALRRALDAKHFAFAPGSVVSAWLDIGSAEWDDFSAYWHGLTLDRYMGDGGTYRLRRYGAFELTRPGPLRQLPHAAYEQPLYVNPLNGGVRREFDPLETGFAEHVVLARILNGLTDVIDGLAKSRQRWNIRLHPYRIRADVSSEGQPTPEGLHRDGVDYIVTLMVRRRNVEGGVTLVTDAQRFPLYERTLYEPMDVLIADDHRTMHSVTPISAVVPVYPAFRDVLVIAFTRV